MSKSPCLALVVCAAVGLLTTNAHADALPVLDMCTLKPDQNTGRSVAQRLMLFEMQGSKRVEAGETVVNNKGKKIGSMKMLKKAGAAKDFPEVFLMTFVMKRFHNVAVPWPASGKWYEKC